MNREILTSSFIRFRQRLRALASGIAGDTEADDVIHDAFCRLWSSRLDPASEDEAMRIAYTSVRNMAIDKVRSSKAHVKVELDAVAGIDNHPDFSDDAAERARLYDRVVELSRKLLPPAQYEILRLHDIEGVGYPEIAGTLSMTPENVRMTLSRARKTIRLYFRNHNN